MIEAGLRALLGAGVVGAVALVQAKEDVPLVIAHRGILEAAS